MMKNRSGVVRLSYGRLVLLVLMAAFPMSIAFAATPPQRDESVAVRTEYAALNPAAGAEEKAGLSVALEMADGSRILATTLEESLRVNTEYMKVEIPLAKIRQCEIDRKHERIVVSLRNGDKVTGSLERHNFQINTHGMGKLVPEFSQIERITFLSANASVVDMSSRPVPIAIIEGRKEIPARPKLLDIQFGIWKPSPATQSGAAAVGKEGDFWNAPAVPWNNEHAESGLKFTDGSPSPIQVVMLNLGGGWHSDGRMGVKAPLMNIFNYPVNNRGGNSRVILQQVPLGKYDLYIYGRKPEPQYYGDYTVIIGETSYGRKTTFHEGDGGQKTEWAEGCQYVKFAGLKVASGDDIDILIRPGGKLPELAFRGGTIGEPGLVDVPGYRQQLSEPAFKAGTIRGAYVAGPRYADAMICGLQLVPAE